MKPETKYKGSIKLSAIGDALGWITEFEKNSQDLIDKYGTDRIESFYDWKKNVGGRFYGFIDNIKAGSYSDDTQLLLAVARSIKKDGTLDHNYFAKIELANWLDYARGGGRTVKAAADKISRKSARWYSNFYSYKANGQTFDYINSGANGAAMRVLPIALANIGNLEKIKEQIFANSITTHGHPRAILGAMLYGYAVNQIIVIRPEDFGWENYIKQIGLDFALKFDLSFIKGNTEITEWIKEWSRQNPIGFEKVYAETINETQNHLRFIYHSLRQELTVKESMARIGCFDPATKGSGIVTVVAGIYLAAKYAKNPLEAILESVNALGSDTDSIAAFAGGLVGALHGQNIIPEKWKKVQDHQYLETIAKKLLAISEDRLDDETFILSKGLKTLNKPENDNYVLNERIEFTPIGEGTIASIDRQATLTKGKYNLIIEASLDKGQTILVSKLFDDLNFTTISKRALKPDTLLLLAAERLSPKTYDKLKFHLADKRPLSKDLIELIESIIRNED